MVLRFEHPGRERTSQNSLATPSPLDEGCPIVFFISNAVRLNPLEPQIERDDDPKTEQFRLSTRPPFFCSPESSWSVGRIDLADVQSFTSVAKAKEVMKAGCLGCSMKDLIFVCLP